MTSGNALDRVLALLADPPEAPSIVDGYVDLLGSDETIKPTLAQRAMSSAILPRIYERAWRPFAFQAFTARSTRDEEAHLRELLAIAPGDTVLDVACGPGNTTRRLHESVGDTGLVVGIDASASMLAQAVRDTPPGTIGYVRGDAHRLPFGDADFDAVSCYGALYLVEDPFTVVREMIRVLRPGGRLAVLTSCHRGPQPLRLVVSATEALSGVRVFGREEVPAAFREAGLVDVEQTVTGWSQVVAGRKPGAERGAGGGR